MRQRGRRSTANLSVIPIERAAERRRRLVRSPPDLTATEQEMVDEVRASCPEDHFVPSDEPLIVAYIQATPVARDAVKDLPASAGLWDRSVKLMACLAAKLRLCPSARTSSRTAGSRVAEHWQPGDD